MNAVLVDATITTRLIDPNGVVRWQVATALGNLAPGALRQRALTHVLDGAPEGTWTVEGTLTAGGELLARDRAHFDVRASLLDRVGGTVEVAHPHRYAGEPQTCTDTVTNRGDAVVVDLRQVLLSRDEATVVRTSRQTMPLAAGASRSFPRAIATDELTPGHYTCLLQLRVDGAWANLDSAGFVVEEPPIDIAATLQAGDRGRLLVLLDPAAKNGKGADPYGPKTSPSPREQRAWLEARLGAAGWSYTIVTDADAFARELHTRGYSVIALFNERVKIAEAVQHELVAAVEQGTGLLVAGAHDRRNGRVEGALGLNSKGRLPHASGLRLYDTPLGPADALDLRLDPKPRRLDPAGARALGVYRSDHPGNGRGKGRGKGPAVALASNTHGEGQSVGAGFDWLLQATVAGETNPYGELLLAALAYIHPQTIDAVAGGVLPLRLTLTNEGTATPVLVRIRLPRGAETIDPGTATVAADAADPETLIWPYQLDVNEQRSLDLWIRLPGTSGPATVTATVLTGPAGDRRVHRRVTYTIEVRPPP